MRAETQSTIESIRKSLRLLAQRMDWDTAPHRLEEMNAMIEDGDLWSDPERAQKLMRDRQMLSDSVETYKRLSADLDANAEMVELAEAEGDAELVAEAEANLKAIAAEAAQQELEALLNGEADGNDTFLEINSGAGGTESCDWASMLARMYVRWAEKKGYKVELQSGNLGRRGGDQVGRLQDQRAERLWLAEIGIGRAPAGPHQPL